MGPQLTPVQKEEHQSAQLSVLTTLLQLTESPGIAQPPQTVSLLLLLSVKTFLTVVIHMQRRKICFLFHFLCSSPPLSLRLAKPGLIERNSHWEGRQSFTTNP